MVKPIWSSSCKDRRDKQEKAMGDTLLQRREQREVEEGQAVIKALEDKLQAMKAAGAGGSRDTYTQSSSEVQLAEQQLKSEQKRVSRLEAELQEQKRATTAAELSASTALRDDQASAIAQRAQQDAEQLNAQLLEKEKSLKVARSRLDLRETIHTFLTVTTMDELAILAEQSYALQRQQGETEINGPRSPPSEQKQPDTPGATSSSAHATPIKEPLTRLLQAALVYEGSLSHNAMLKLAYPPSGPDGVTRAGLKLGQRMLAEKSALTEAWLASGDKSPVEEAMDGLKRRKYNKRGLLDDLLSRLGEMQL